MLYLLCIPKGHQAQKSPKKKKIHCKEISKKYQGIVPLWIKRIKVTSVDTVDIGDTSFTILL
jgi:hypothetical protein